MRNPATISLLALAFMGNLIVSHDLRSQGLYNDSNIYIDGVSVFVDGEVRNDGKFQNEGTVSFTGDWESSGTYNGQGVLEANGNGPQKISHYGQSVGTLLIEGWGQKYIKGDLTVSNDLNLKHGIVEVSARDGLILELNAVVNGGSPDAYVDGPLTATGNGYKFFPLGKNGTYAPIEFLDVKGQGARYSVDVFEDAPITSLENVVVRPAVYWLRKDVQGRFESSRVAIDYNRNSFENPANIILVSGTQWDKPFATITEIQLSEETDKIFTMVPVSAPIILLGELSEKWTEADFYLSTALSPHAYNAENQNVKIFGERLSSDLFRFDVFNRWGELIYETTSLEEMSTNGWDGRTLNGDALMSGTYPYRLTAVDKMGNKFEKKGVITIVH
jgi:CHU_C Type IX secretion signal domain